MTTLPTYLALDSNGAEYERPCLFVGELPHKMRFPALKLIARSLSVKLIQFGIPVHVTLGLTRRDAKKRACDWLMKSGANMPVSMLTDIDKNLLAKLAGYDTEELTFRTKLREAATGREICPLALAPFETDVQGDETTIRVYEPRTNTVVSTAIGAACPTDAD